MAEPAVFQVIDMSRKSRKRKRKGHHAPAGHAHKARHVTAGKAHAASTGLAARVAGVFRAILALFTGERHKGASRRAVAGEAEAVDGAAMAASAAAAANMAAITMDASAIAVDAASRAMDTAPARKPHGLQKKR
jgi:hypothetical protein